MANANHIKMIQKDVDAWNEWRLRQTREVVDLSGADFSGLSGRNAALFRANLRNANFQDARLSRADFYGSNISGAIFAGANLRRAKFEKANLCGADLTRADLRKADFLEANLEEGVLREADLRQAQLIDANLNAADLTGANVYGVSVWNVELEGTSQNGLVISRENEPLIIVDQLEVAQFIYLLLDNKKLRNLLDTITSKVVLILGRFTGERKAVLDSLRHELRRRGLAPIMFDFDKPTSKDTTGTVETLARMARLVIADLTDPSSIPHELATVVPYLRTTPVVPLRLKGTGGYTMFEDLLAYDRWVLPVHEYVTEESLIADLGVVLAPAEERLKQLRPNAVAEGHALPV
jgi:hypothetical protein